MYFYCSEIETRHFYLQLHSDIVQMFLEASSKTD